MAAKKFKYRLEPLLKVRKHREKERQKEHAAAQARAHEQRECITTIDDKRRNTIGHQRNKLAGSLSVAETLVCSRYLTKLKRDRVAGTELLYGLEKEAQERRRKLVDAARERKIYEMLKEKQQLLHKEGIEKQEQKELGEIATVNFRRKKEKGQ